MSKPATIKKGALTDHIFFGLYGDPGIGKSRLIGTSPGKVLIIRAPQSHLDSLLPADKARLASGEIEQAVINDYDEFYELLDYLRSDGSNYDWVWLEDAQTIFDVLLDDIWDTVKTERPHRDRIDLGLDQGEYGRNMERYSRWIRHIVGPDAFNFGYSAHAEVGPSPDKDDEGDPIDKMLPWVQGKGMPTKFMGYMNIVGYYTKAKIGGEEGRRVLRTESSPNYYAKDQFDAFGGRVVDPTMPKIEDLIKKSSGRKKPPAASSSAKRPAKARRRVVKSTKGRS